MWIFNDLVSVSDPGNPYSFELLLLMRIIAQASRRLISVGLFPQEQLCSPLVLY